MTQTELYKAALEALAADGWTFAGTTLCCSNVRKYRKGSYVIKISRTHAVLIKSNSTLANEFLGKIKELLQRAALPA